MISKIISTTLKISLFLITGLCSAQTNYYFANNGSDSNNGTSQSTPWRTISKFNQSVGNGTFGVGDVIHFRKGDVWGEGAVIYDLKSGITITSYGTASEKPIISNVATLNETWTLHGTQNNHTIWKCSPSAFFHSTNSNDWDIMRLLVNDSEQLKCVVPSDIGKYSYGLNNQSTKQTWYYDKDTDELFLASSLNPNSLKIEASTAFSTIFGRDVNKVIIKNIEVQGANGPSIRFVDSDLITITNCTVGKFSATGIAFVYDCSSVTIKDNIIDSGWDASLVYGKPDPSQSDVAYSARGVGDGIIFSRGVRHSFIYRNDIINWGHTGIEFLSDDSTYLGVNNNNVYSNYITAENMSYGRAIGIDGVTDRCRSNVFRYNYIESCRARIQFNGNNNRFHHNIVKQTLNSPCKDIPYGQGIEMSIYGEDLMCQSNRIDNNLFIDNDSFGVSVENYFHASQYDDVVSNLYIRNNIFVNNNSNSSSLSNASIKVSDRGTKIRDIRILNNLFYDFTDTTDDELINYRSQGIVALGSVTVEGVDQYVHNLHDNPDYDPLNDYELSSVSPCIDAGITVEYEAYADDYDGDDFPFNNTAPDIGPQEYQYSLRQSINHIKNGFSIKDTDDPSLNNTGTSLKVFPNPASDVINISSDKNIKHVELYNASGQLLLKNSNTKINVSSLEQGIYFIKITLSDRIHKQLLVVN